MKIGRRGLSPRFVLSGGCLAAMVMVHGCSWYMFIVHGIWHEYIIVVVRAPVVMSTDCLSIVELASDVNGLSVHRLTSSGFRSGFENWREDEIGGRIQNQPIR